MPERSQSRTPPAPDKKPGGKRGRSSLGPCFDLAADMPAARARLERSAAAVRQLAAHRQYLDRLNELRGNREACAGLHDRTADRAYEAESAYRVLAFDCLESINLVRDGGALPGVLRRAARAAGKEMSSDQIVAQIEGARKALARELPDLDLAFFDDAVEQVRRHEVTLASDGKQLVFGMLGKDGKRGRFAVPVDARAGAQGRVSARDFFAPAAARPVAAPEIGPGWTMQDCHSRGPQRTDPGQLRPVDLYGNLVAGLATGRDAMYRHARKVEELGHGETEGSDPVTAVVAAIIIIGAVLVIAGVTIEVGCATGAWSGGVCDWGWALIGFGALLIVGGICVAVGACTLILSIFAAITV